MTPLFVGRIGRLPVIDILQNRVVPLSHCSGGDGAGVGILQKHPDSDMPLTVEKALQKLL